MGTGPEMTEEDTHTHRDSQTHTHTSHSYNYKQYTNSIPNPQYGKTKTFSPAYLPWVPKISFLKRKKNDERRNLGASGRLKMHDKQKYE